MRTAEASQEGSFGLFAVMTKRLIYGEFYPSSKSLGIARHPI
jgi:hypothetical protein